MTKLLQALYTYAYENRMVYSQEDKAQYRESSLMADRAHEELKGMLSEYGQQRLEDYIGEEELMQGLELETMFRAGLSIGLELSRL